MITVQDAAKLAKRRNKQDGRPNHFVEVKTSGSNFTPKSYNIPLKFERALRK